jgi:hypothetical protein
VKTEKLQDPDSKGTLAHHRSRWTHRPPAPRASRRRVRPRGWGRRGRAPRLAPGGHDLNRWGERTPCPAASDGRSTLGRPGHHAVRGIGDRLRRNPHPLVLERVSREAPAPSAPSPRSEVRSAGARLVWPPCRARYRTAAPGSCAETRPCRRTAIPSPRRAHHAPRPDRSHHPSAYIINRDSLSPVAGAVRAHTAPVRPAPCTAAGVAHPNPPSVSYGHLPLVRSRRWQMVHVACLEPM